MSGMYELPDFTFIERELAWGVPPLWYTNPLLVIVYSIILFTFFFVIWTIILGFIRWIASE